MRTSVVDIASKIQTEADAYLYMEGLRWSNGVICPHCGSDAADYIRPMNGVSRKTRTGAPSERRVWRCADCRKQFSVITGTVFHGTKIPLRKWVLVIFEMVASKNGVAAREIERKYDMCPRSAWFMLHCIREAMSNDGLVAKTVNTTVVADETYIGGLEKNKHVWQRDPHARGRGTHQTPVFTLIDANTGEARSAVTPNIAGETSRDAIKANVDPAGSVLYSDSLASYNLVGAEFCQT